MAPAGYPDYQRVVNWDGPVKFSAVQKVVAGVDRTTIMDVRRYAYLGGYMQANTGLCWVGVSWYSDAAGQSLVAVRNFTMVASVGNPAQLRLPNIGPYCQVSFLSIGGAQFTYSAGLFGTNRVHPLEFVPSQQVLIEQENVPLAAGVFGVYYPSDFYSGPVRVSVYSTVVGLTWEVQWMDTAGNWHHLDSHPMAGANQWESQNSLVPSPSWRFVAVNNANAGNIYLVVTPSMTGST